MTKSILTVAFILTTAVVVAPRSATAQNEVLAEMYGRGVHAYYSGDNNTAVKFLTMVIDNGSQDPRAFYFRGIVAYSMGQMDAAKDDWRRGAEMEASGNMSNAIGRSLSRFQGTGRLELETIREETQLKELAKAAKRSQARYGEITEAESRVLRKPPQPATPPVASTPPAPATPPAAPPVTVPPVTDAADPFADDMAIGEPSIQSDDALKGAMEDPFAGKASIPAGSVPPNDAVNPFGGASGGDASDPFGSAPSSGADPFGSAPSTGADPFGGAAAGADPFGSSPAPAAGADPFGGAPSSGADPFGGAAPAPATAPAKSADPFGGGSDAGAGADPFGGSDTGAAADPFGGAAPAPAAAPAKSADPFGGGSDAGAGADPFGGAAPAAAPAKSADPFGDAGDAAAGADPFGGGSDAGADPFGN